MTDDVNRPAGDPSTLGYPHGGVDPVPPVGTPVVPAPAARPTGSQGTTSGGAADDAKQQAAEVAGSAKEQAAEVAGSAKESVQQVGQTAREEARRTAGEARRQAQDLLRQSQSELSEQAGAQQQRLAGGLRSFSAELDQMASGAEQEGLATHVARWAAETSEGAGQWLEDRDPAGVLEDVKRYARRRPGMFILAAAGAGLLVGRIARSLRDEASDDDDGDTAASSRPATASGSYQRPVQPATYPPTGTVPPPTYPPTSTVPPAGAGFEPGGLR